MFANCQKGGSIQNMLDQCDIFGVPISIKFHGKEKHKSRLGVIVTLTLLIAVFLQAFDEIKMLFSFSNYTVIYQENIVKQPKPFEINSKQFTLAIGLQDSKFQSIFDEQIFDIEAEFITFQKNIEMKENNEFMSNYKGIKLVSCTQQHFQIEDTIDYFLRLPYQKLFCLPLDTVIQLEGQYGADVFKYLRFRVNRCANHEKCKPSRVIDEKLNDSSLQIFFVNYAIEITDKNNPFKAIPQNSSWKLGSTMKNINSDDGLFTSQHHRLQRLVQSNDREQIVNIQSKTLFEINIGLEKNREAQYYRSYTKILTTFSKLGGLFNFFYTNTYMLSIFQNSIQIKNKEIQSSNSIDFNQDMPSPLKRNIANSPLKSDINLKIEKKINCSIQNDEIGQTTLNMRNISIDSPNLNSFENYQQNSFSHKLNELSMKESDNNSAKNQQISLNFTGKGDLQMSNVRKNILKRKTTFRQQKEEKDKFISSIFKTTINSFKVRLVDIFISYLCQRRSKSKMIRYGLNKLNYLLDLNTIITKLLEIEKLKQLLLNKDQIKLFEFIPQPIVHEEQFEKENIEGMSENQSFAMSNKGILYEDQRSITQKAKEAEYAYHKIVNQNKFLDSQIDRKLLQLIDPRVSTQFEQNTFSKNCQNFTQMIEQSRDCLRENNKEKENNKERENIREIVTPKSLIKNRSNFYLVNMNDSQQKI